MVVFDLEADGLYEGATRVWCGVFKDLHEMGTTSFTPKDTRDMLSYIRSQDIILGHNIIEYDIPLLNKLYDFKYEGIVIDTLVMSRLIAPDYMKGRYSIEEWGKHVGIGKPEHETWDRYDSDMLHRCERDTEINKRIVPLLLKAGAMSYDDLKSMPRYIDHELH